MSEWVPIQDDGFVAADVIRWQEGIYKPRRSRKAKPARIGDQIVTAEVLKEPDAKGWVRLLVRKCEILTELTSRKLFPITVNTEIRRAKKTIMRGKPERLLWSDEDARAIVADKGLETDSSESKEKGPKFTQ